MSVVDTARQAAIAKIRATLEKKYSDSSELFPDFRTIRQIKTIPTGSIILDCITGVAGYPRGRVTEIYGDYSTGKTTLALLAIASLQKADPATVALFVDYEHAIDLAYARKLGVDISEDRFILSQPEYFEQGDMVIDSFLEADLVDLIVIDSTAAMTPRAELEGEIDDEGGTQKGMQSALMARFLARTTKKLNRGRKPALLLLNQIRAFIQIGGRPQKNAPKTQPAGGNATKFYTTIRLELEIIQREISDEKLRGTKGTDRVYTQNTVRVTAVKNKVAPPHIRGSIVLEYGKGVNNLASLVELAEGKLAVQSASYFKYDGGTPETTFSCRGRDAFTLELERNPKLRASVESKVLAAMRAEQAKDLGLTELKMGPAAKEIEAPKPPPPLVLSDEGPKKATNGNGVHENTLPVEDVE
jgi:recombination protein RecA